MIVSNGKYAGTKRKGILGEENYFDKDGHLVATTRDGILGTKITVDQGGQYMGTSYKSLGDDQLTIFEDEGNQPEQHSGGAWGLLFFVICIVIAILMFIFR